MYSTPGVYIEEKNAFSNSVVPVATAIPCFIGFTEKAVRDNQSISKKLFKISSLEEYIRYFGGKPTIKYTVTINEPSNAPDAPDPIVVTPDADTQYYLYFSLKLYFHNGGGDCYIYSVGNYASKKRLEADMVDAALKALEKEPEPTMILIPDGHTMAEASDYYALWQQVLPHCEKMINRFAILDIHGGGDKEKIKDNAAIDELHDAFKENISSRSLNYGAVYWPWLQTSIVQPSDLDFRNISNLVALQEEIKEEAVGRFPNLPDGSMDPRALEIGILVDYLGKDEPTGFADEATIYATIAGEEAAKATPSAARVATVVVKTARAVAKTAKSARALIGGDAPSQLAVRAAAEAAIAAKNAATNADLSVAVAAATTAAASAKAAATAVLAARDASAATTVRTTAAQARADVATAKENATKARADATTARENARVARERADGADPADPDLNSAAATAETAATTAETAATTTETALTAAETALTTAETALTAAVTEIRVAKTATSLQASAFEAVVARQHNALLQISPLYKAVISNLREAANIQPTSGGMAGVYKAVDSSIGTHQAPANISVISVTKPLVTIDDHTQENLNIPIDGKAINAIRSFPGKGTLVWGARTMDGNSQDWRYISVRRTVSMIELSIKYAAEAFVFEPNVASTWSNLKAMISNFLTNMWYAGALAGATPESAFSVEVGLGSTMTSVDILDGYMRISVKIAVTRPAEFIVITFQQQMQTS